MGRSKGYVVSEETKNKMKAAAAKRKKIRKTISKKENKPILYLTGEEENAFDFWKCIRKTFRPILKNVLCHTIELEVAVPDVFFKPKKIIKILEKYATIQYMDVK